MRHRDYKELIHLASIQELSDDERQVLDKHLAECQECQKAFNELVRMNELLRHHPRGEVTDDLLAEARQELRVALRLEQIKRSRWAEFFERFNILSIPTVRVAFASAAMVVIGLGLGYLLFVPSVPGSQFGDTAATERGETRVSNLRFISQETEAGEVEFAFEMVTPIRMRGSVKDYSVQRVLAQALLNEQNPGARLQTVSTLAAQVQPSVAPDREIKAALIRTLKSDQNAGVRREALRIIQTLPMDEEVKQAVFFVLRHETNPAMRIEAINYLEKPVLAGKMLDQDILSVLREKMQTDENNYIRTRARNVYEEVKQQ